MFKLKSIVIWPFLACLLLCTSCQQCSSSSPSTMQNKVVGACVYDFDLCQANSKIKTEHHKCKQLSKKECLALWAKPKSDFCFENNTKAGETLAINISFFAGLGCPPNSPGNTDLGACYYDKEVCKVDKKGTRIEIVHHKCEQISKAECGTIKEECDARAAECLLTSEEDDIPTFCFASFAKDGDSRPLNAEFFAGASCPKSAP